MTHRVVGTSKERPGITDGETLKRWLYNAFMRGSMVKVPSLSVGPCGQPPLQKPTHLLGAALWAKEGSPRRLDA